MLLGDLSAELDERLRLEDAVAGELGSRNGPIVKGREIEALVVLERLVGDDLERSVSYASLEVRKKCERTLVVR